MLVTLAKFQRVVLDHKLRILLGQLPDTPSVFVYLFIQGINFSIQFADATFFLFV